MSGDQPSASEPVELPIELIVAPEQAGMRLDIYLAAQFPTHSRVMLRKVINAAAAKVDGLRVKAAHRLRAGERMSVTLPALAKEGPQPEDIPLEILYEDDAIAVVNKPPGMVVHPAKGHWSGTLTAALQFHFDRLSKAGGPQRPGVVHRLDRDTSGVIVIAKTDSAHFQLSHQFEHRQVEKEYFALCAGVPDLDRDVVDLPVGAHPHQREKMARRRDHTTSREAQTYYEVVERFDGFAAVKALPKTGRTHQIRLHLASIGCPVLCDRLYGGRATITRGEIRRDPSDDLILLDRQALHARRLKLAHPTTGAPLEFTAPLPPDIEAALTELRAFRQSENAKGKKK
jgi:23S rRNA pseudouridine1911/1915/1917 synthase